MTSKLSHEKVIIHMKTHSYFFVLIFLSGCAFHSGMMTANPEYTQNNLELKELATAEANSVRFLGIGGLSKQALVLEAKKNLYQNYPLNQGQAYANISVDIRDLYLFIYHKTTITLSADIIGDVNEQSESDLQQLFEQMKVYSNPTRIFEVGDQVFKMRNNVPYKYNILKLDGRNDIVLGVPSNSVKIKTTYQEIYHSQDDPMLEVRYNIGDTVLAFTYMKWREAIITGLNEKKAIVEILDAPSEEKYFEVQFSAIKSKEE